MAKAVVRYKGLSDVREMTVDQLAAIGIKVKDDLVWHAGNHWKQEVNLTQALEELLAAEGTFYVVSDTDSGDERIVMKQTKADDSIGATAVDANTGQVSEPG